jgi:hypothetical protein
MAGLEVNTLKALSGSMDWLLLWGPWGKENSLDNPKPRRQLGFRSKRMRHLFTYILVRISSWRERWACLISRIRKNSFQKDKTRRRGKEFVSFITWHCINLEIRFTTCESCPLCQTSSSKHIYITIHNSSKIRILKWQQKYFYGWSSP